MFLALDPDDKRAIYQQVADAVRRVVLPAFSNLRPEIPSRRAGGGKRAYLEERLKLKTGLARTAAALLAVAGAAFAQAAAQSGAPLSFEVASVRPSGPLDPAAIVSGRAHVGMTVDQARVDIGMLSLMNLICAAYKVRPYQVKGGADWVNTERFDIVAKLPEGASREQVPEMLQSLLAERFKLALHRDNKETPVYALTAGKGGLKLKEAPQDTPAPQAADSTEQAATPPPEKGEIVVGRGENQMRMKQTEGGVVANSKETGPMRISMEDGIIHMQGEKMSMEMLTTTLSQFLDRPVVDLTELKGRYAMELDIGMADAVRAAVKAGAAMPPAMTGPAAGANASPADAAPDPSGSSLFTSVERLGLKLEPRKLPYEFLVIDHLEKMPTEN